VSIFALYFYFILNWNVPVSTCTTLGVWGGETDIVIFHFEPGEFYHKYLKGLMYCAHAEAKIGVKQPIYHILTADFSHFLHIIRAS
jgi:hypothetical protein